MGMAYAQTGQGERGIHYLERAIGVWESPAAHDIPNRGEEMSRALFNLAFAYEQNDRIDDALQRYQQAVEINPQFGDAYLQMASLRNKQQDYEQVVTLLRRAIPLLPDQPSLYMHLGDTLNNMKRWDDAVTSYKQGLALEPSNAKWHVHIGDALLNLRHLDDALIHYTAAVKMSPNDETAVIGLLDVKQELADWRDWDSLLNKVRQAIKRTLSSKQASPLSPYQSLFIPLTPKEQMDIAVSWATPAIADARRAVSWTSPYHKQKRALETKVEVISNGSNDDSNKADGVVRRNRKLRIGYLSRRFHNYAGTQLMLRVFGLHDRSRVTVYAYANGASDNSEQRQTVSHDSDVFVDVYGMTPQQAATKIANDGIDVLIDYDGAHNFNSLSILALRPAPVQLTYLGFAGTSVPLFFASVNPFGLLIIFNIVYDGHRVHVV
jgi:protein O-GlcNAc transferase